MCRSSLLNSKKRKEKQGFSIINTENSNDSKSIKNREIKYNNRT